MRIPLSVLAFCGLLSLPLSARAEEVEPEDLKPGLIGQFQDAAGARVERLEPGVAVRLAADEAPHPTLASNGGTYRWSGYLKVMRNGEYAFAARLRGGVQVTLDGQEIFSASHLADKPEQKDSAKLPLKAGIRPFTVVYQRPPQGDAVLELLWKVPQFRFEPLPSEQLGHAPAARTAGLQAQSLSDHGRYLVEELGCVQCHAATDPVGKTLLGNRVGPNLTQIASRVYPGWLEAWLLDPAQLRPHTSMPDLFADDATGRAEARAVASYLMTLGKPMSGTGPRFSPQDTNRFVNRGQALFTTVGCAACHQEKPAPKEGDLSVYGLLAPQGAQSHYALGALGSKTRHDLLAGYLQNPHANNPTTRMPNMTLSGEDARDIALYLSTTRDKRIPTDATAPTQAPPGELIARALSNKDVSRLSVPQQWQELGKALVSAKGCVNCHVMANESNALPKLASKPLAELAPKAAGGCVDGEANRPRYTLSETDRKALSAFLREGLKGSGSKAPTHAARVAFKRFNCLNCHQREGEGGLSVELVESMQKLEKSENVDDVRPPTLNGVGHKLLTPWFRTVLVGGGRSRPWMTLKMPQYGEANVGALAEGVTHLEGAETESQVASVEVTPAKVEAGRLMVGKSGLGCIGCHDIAGIANTGTRGPDLSSTNQRVRYSWYRDWLEQPQRMAPNTRMPQVIIDGKSLFPGALGGNADAQAEAMWAYLSLGSKLPLPAGLEAPKGLIVQSQGQNAEILRTFLPDAGNRAIAVAFPGGINVAFDANQCSLSYGWAGSFLDASPVWNNRGGAPAKVLGPKFWTAPRGNPWSVGGSQEPPDFVKRADDPAYGKSLPDLQLFHGERKVYFDGYALDPQGAPTFRYRVLGDGDATLKIQETVTPMKASIATGIHRDFKLEIPARAATYFLAGETRGEPRLFNADGIEIKLDLKSGAATADTAGKLLLLPADGDGSTVLDATHALGAVKWRLQPRNGGGWQALVSLPMLPEAKAGEMRLRVWSVGKADGAFLKALANP